jgi:uncharacterized membrane protein YuzA (DUF378 family)
MFLVDAATLWLVLIGAFDVGLKAFQIDPLVIVFGSWAHVVSQAIGAAAIWQILRQKFR